MASSIFPSETAFSCFKYHALVGNFLTQSVSEKRLQFRSNKDYSWLEFSRNSLFLQTIIASMHARHIFGWWPIPVIPLKALIISNEVYVIFLIVTQPYYVWIGHEHAAVCIFKKGQPLTSESIYCYSSEYLLCSIPSLRHAARTRRHSNRLTNFLFLLR